MLLAFTCLVTATAPIIGGQGKYQYQYVPGKMALPEGANATNCHGYSQDKAGNLYLTYEPDHVTDKHCLVRWAEDGTDPQWMDKGGDALCGGTPHGLKVLDEDGVEYLYHANNDKVLSKTTLNGTIIWQVSGYFGQNSSQTSYRPTWFAVPPKSKYIYLADGYGSNFVYVFTRDGVYTNISYGGRGTTNGKFETCHGITYDPRNELLVVSDRENHRLQYFKYDGESPDVFDYVSNVTMPDITRVCNIRMYPALDGMAVVPDLTGPVAILDKTNTVLSVVNVSALLGDEGHLHPHDAMLLPNGDLVVATWNPGRTSYWKWLQ